MKNDLPYFTHDNDARNHAKMKALRARFGWTGYGQFWALNEMIAGAAEARLDLSRKVVRASVACELGMTQDALEDFLAFLSNPDECGLVHYLDGVLTTDRTQEDYAKVKAKREHDSEKTKLRRAVERENSKVERDIDKIARDKPTEQSRAEQIREEKSSSAARVSLPVDKSEEQAPAITLEDFAAERVRHMRGVRNPEAMVRKLVNEPDVVAAWRKAAAPPPPVLPPPPLCKKCGAEPENLKRWPWDPPNVMRCMRCRTAVEYDETWQTWSEYKQEAVG